MCVCVLFLANYEPLSSDLLSLPGAAVLSCANEDAPTWMLMCRVGQNHIYTRCIYVVFCRDLIKYTVIQSTCTQFWTTLRTCVYVYVCNLNVRAICVI